MKGVTKLVKPDNVLKKKVGTGGFKESDIAKAQNMIETNTIDFRPIAKDFISALDQMVKDIRAGNLKGTEALGSVSFPLMQLRAQGSLFHFPLITHLSDIVVDFLDTVNRMDSDIVDILTAYSKAVGAVISLNLKNESSKIGKDLCKELGDACQRYKKAKMQK